MGPAQIPCRVIFERRWYWTECNQYVVSDGSLRCFAKKAVSVSTGSGFKKNYDAQWDISALDISQSMVKRDTFFSVKNLQSELTLSLDSGNSTSL